MPDRDIYYCYPNSNVLINKLGIKDNSTLFKAEKELTYIRLQELQNKTERLYFSLCYKFRQLLTSS